MTIPDDCMSGAYLLRTSTTWLRNAGPDAYGYNQLIVINPSRPFNKTAPPDYFRNADIRFYPEGGSLVYGVENHVIFTVTDGTGNPVNYAGNIHTSEGLAVCSTETRFPGVGSFVLVPRSGDHYKMVSSEDTLAGGTDGFSLNSASAGVPLPDPVEEGCAVRVNQVKPEETTVMLRFSERLVKAGEEVIAGIRSKSGHWWMREFPADSLIIFNIKNDELAGEFHQLLVWTGDKKLLALRDFQSRQLETVTCDLSGLKTVYSPRDTIRTDLYLSTTKGEPSSARLSISVCRSGTFLKENRYNSMIYNLLPDIQVPGFNDGGTCPDQDERSDLLLAASSGHRMALFPEDFKNIRYLPEMDRQVAEGTVVDRVSGLPVADQRVLLSFIDSLPSLYSGVTDSSGRFFISMDHLRGEREMVIQLYDQVPQAMILMEVPFPPDPLPEIHMKHADEEELQCIYSDLLLNQQINHAFGLSHESILHSYELADPVFDSYDQQIIMDDYIRLPLMEEVFRELGKRVMLIREQNGMAIRLLDQQTNRIIGKNPLFLLDGMPFSDPQLLLQLNPLQLKDIRFISTRYFLQDLIFDGIISMRSLEGDAPLPGLPGSATRVLYRGLPALEYRFEPDPAALENTHLPLVMNTLCFIPEFIYTRGSENTIQWIAPDSKGTYDIIIKIWDAEGNMGETSYNFRIE
jgi:hypothetical protein